MLYYYYVKVQNFDLQRAYRLYAAGSTIGVGSDCPKVLKFPFKVKKPLK